MRIKSLIIIIAIVAGFSISVATAFMTYIIIGKAIMAPMIIKIVFTVLSVIPFIGILSYFFGRYLSKKFHFIQNRLEDIKQENYKNDISKNPICELNEINSNMNFLSTQLKNSMEDLKKKNQNLSTLLISMAHDIKTPITILNGYIEEIEDDLISKEDLPSALTHMKEEIKFLDELTIDMLQFITSMQNTKTKQSIALNNFIDTEIFTILPKKDNVVLINEIDGNLYIEFNKMDLKKIALNLLSNAIKHTTSGYVKVTNENDKIIFENTGEQIPQEYKEKIFEPFFTVSKSKNRKKSGFGLGLAIVKNLSENNNYDCILEYSDNKKTIFCLYSK